MPVPDLIRESFIGQVVYYASGKRYLQYAEERPGFVIPARYDLDRRASWAQLDSDNNTLDDKKPAAGQTVDVNKSEKPDVTVTENAETDAAPSRDPPTRTSNGDTERGTVPDEMVDPNVVDWYGPDDPECPFNVRYLSYSTRHTPNRLSRSGHLQNAAS